MRKQDDMKPSQIKSTDMTQRPVGREYGRIPLRDATVWSKAWPNSQRYYTKLSFDFQHS